jgi:hypothetical protein
MDPSVEIGLEFDDRTVDLLSEGHAVELVQHGLMEALDDAVGLRTFGLGTRMVNVLDRQIKLIFVVFGIAANIPCRGRSRHG